MIARMAHRLQIILAVLAWSTILCTSAYATAIIGHSKGKDVELEVSEGALVRLDNNASSVFIANPEIADVTVKSPRLVYVFGRSQGETSLYAVDKDDNVVANVRVRVVHNLSALQDAINEVVQTGGVSATSVDGGIVLSGAVRNATDAENARVLAERFLAGRQEIINQIAVTAPNQVNLRVRVAEVQRNVVNQLGINWESVVRMGGITFGLSTGLFGATGGLGQVGNNLLTSRFKGTLDLNFLLDALAQDGLITVLAEPNLTATSGETASFLAGGEFPIPVAFEDNELTIEFKEFGVSLSFTPTILSENRISLRVRPEVSQLSTTGAIILNGFSIPSLTTRRAETTVALASGQSFAIAGLLLNNTLHDTDKVPGLGDIPVLGRLFMSDRFERNESELVIVVTPYLVQPVNDQRIPLPTDPYSDFTSSNTQEEVSGSAFVSQTLPPPTTGESQQGLTAPAGFILE